MQRGSGKEMKGGSGKEEMQPITQKKKWIAGTAGMQRGSGKEMQGGSGKDMSRKKKDIKELYEKKQGDSVKLERVWESDEQLSELIKEIMSLGRERKDLLDSLTPSHSHWERKFQATTGRENYMSEKTASASVQQQLHSMSQNQNTASQSIQPHVVPYALRDNKKEVASLFSVILKDMEESGHRMLSMAYAVEKSGTSLPLYKADELVSRTSSIGRISEAFYNYIEDHNMQQGEGQQVLDVEDSNFLFLSQYYSKYNNELVLNLEKEKEKEKEKKEKEEKEKEEEEEDEEMVEGEDVSTMEFLKSITNFHKECFSMHRTCWERVWGGDIGRCGNFDDATTLSSLQYTSCPIPGHAPVAGSTLQIYFIKILNLRGSLTWPLKVRGVVAARDTVDHNRNILFARSRSNYQILTEKDPFLSLTGPSRAIWAEDPIDFEVELKINDGAELITLHKIYDPNGSTSLFIHSCKCTVELSVRQFDTPLQATIVSVRVAKGNWPFKYGCRVVGTEELREVVLLDYHGEDLRVGSDGYLHLSRNVVSVDLDGPLRVTIQAYSESGGPAQKGYVDFPVEYWETSKRELLVGNSELEIVVAWSYLVKDKLDLLGLARQGAW